MSYLRFVVTTVATAGALVPLAFSPVASANPVPAPPYVDHVEWAKWGDLSSLRVYPTVAGRQASVVDPVDVGEAWAEVLRLSPDADMPGMWDQFVCHWNFAERVQPGKTSWNLEPWRPAVDVDTLVATGCNPGGTEEPF
jgi:hypothetical protein